jgi:hypothetical protein
MEIHSSGQSPITSINFWFFILIEYIIGTCLHIISPHVSVLLCRSQATFPLRTTNSLQIICQIYSNIHIIHDAEVYNLISNIAVNLLRGTTQCISSTVHNLNAVKWLLFSNLKLCMRRKTWVTIRPFSSTSVSLIAASAVQGQIDSKYWLLGMFLLHKKPHTHTLNTRSPTHAILLDITCTAIQIRNVAGYVYSCGVHYLPHSLSETTDFHTSLSSSICQDFMAQERCNEGFRFFRRFSMVDAKCLRTKTSSHHQGNRKACSLKGMYEALRGFNRQTLLTHLSGVKLVWIEKNFVPYGYKTDRQVWIAHSTHDQMARRTRKPEQPTGEPAFW